MMIEQQKFSNRHTFTFSSDSLNFAYRDRSESGDIDIPYAEFPLKSSIQVAQNLWLRSVGFLWCALGVIEVVFALFTRATLAGTGFWLLLGIGCLLWAHFTKVAYTVLSTNRGSVWVIQDANDHDRIMNEIRSRRKEQLLALFGDIHLENGLDKEVRKFRWLAEQQALTAEQAEQRIAQVQAALGATAAPSSVTVKWCATGTSRRETQIV